MIQTPLIIDSGLILRIIGQNRAESFDASNMALITLPGYFCAYATELFYRTLCAKSKIWPALIAGGSCAICALLLQLLSFYILHWNLTGIALASSAALICSAVILTIIFLAHRFPHELNLFVPSIAALDGWWDMGVNYASSLVLIIAIKIILELPVVVGGLIGAVELAAANVIRRYSVILALLIFGFTTASISRIGAAVGARSRSSLYVYTSATFIFFALFLLIFTILNILLRYPLASLTTTNPLVIEMSASLTILVALVDCLKLFIVSTFLSIFRGVGLMVFPTVTTLTCEYIFGLTLGMYLSFYVKLGIAGVLWAMLASLCVELILNILYLWLFLWPRLIADIDKSQQEENSSKGPNEEQKNEAEIQEDLNNQPKEITPLMKHHDQESAISISQQNAEIPKNNFLLKPIIVVLTSIILIALAICLKIFFS